MPQAHSTQAGSRRAAGSPKPSLKPDLFQDLLVHQDESEASRNALLYATAIADEADGNVAAVMLYSINIYPVGVGEAMADVWLAAQRQAEEEAAKLEKLLRERLAKDSPHAELRRSDNVGSDSSYKLAELGRYADAVVIGWRAGGGTDEQRRLFNTTLFHSGRPVILVPDSYKTPQTPRNIMIAWSPSKEAARAVHDALPLLRNAQSVRITVVDDSSTRTEQDNAGVDIARHLARHEVHAEVKHVPRGSHGVTRTLLDEAKYFGADLIVLGGYGHSRLAEWILGGMTREILASADVPLFFSH
jgi:nucleotide-binding universal stress UspA family protein